MAAFTEVGTFVIETCIKCGVAFGLPESYQRERRNDHKDFCCPNGHQQYYPGKSDAEKLRDQLAAQEQATQRERQRLDQARAELRDKQNHLNAERAAKARLKNRVAHGVCPCCQRTFQDLARHMLAKHPEEVPGPVK